MVIVMDTCTLVAGILNQGNEMKILNLVFSGALDLIYSKELLIEYTFAPSNILAKSIEQNRNLDIKKARQLSYKLASKISDAIYSCANKVLVTSKGNYIKSDSSDDKLVNLAIDGNAEYIISNNTDLFDEVETVYNKNGDEIKIVGPYEFYNIVYKVHLWKTKVSSR